MNLGAQKSQNYKVQKMNFIMRVLRFFNVKEMKPVIQYNENETLDLLNEIRIAKNEWISSNVNFEYAEEMEMIDYYTYKIKACQTRYEYLIRKAKEKGIKVDLIEKTSVDQLNFGNFS
ncbi:MAG: YaaL family protein [Clostridia bacterium]|nr:YaaL family protein [Clostridia bacterium]